MRYVEAWELRKGAKGRTDANVRMVVLAISINDDGHALQSKGLVVDVVAQVAHIPPNGIKVQQVEYGA